MSGEQPNDMGNGNGAIVRATEVRRRFGAGDAAVDAVAGVTLSIEAGAMVAIMGPSGSGKRARSADVDDSAPVRFVARELGPHARRAARHHPRRPRQRTSRPRPTARRTVELDGPRLEVIAGDDTQITQLAARGAVREREPKR
jgi:hypothetical protein